MPQHLVPHMEVNVSQRTITTCFNVFNSGELHRCRQVFVQLLSVAEESVGVRGSSSIRS